MDAQEELAFLRSVAASQLQTIKTLTLGCEKYGLTETTPIVRHLAAQDDEIDRLRAELTELRKPDCRTCAYIRTDNGDFDCGRFWIDRDFCVNGNKYKATIYPLRLYEKEGK